jgi:hypothetical protein
MSQDLETEIRQLLHRRAELADEHAITGYTVRARAKRGRYRLVSSVLAPLGAAAAISALVTGIAFASPALSGSAKPAPTKTASQTATHANPFGIPLCGSGVATLPSGNTVCGISISAGSGSATPDTDVPKCPATTTAPGETNTVCRIGTPPNG